MHEIGNDDFHEKALGAKLKQYYRPEVHGIWKPRTTSSSEDEDDEFEEDHEYFHPLATLEPDNVCSFSDANFPETFRATPVMTKGLSEGGDLYFSRTDPI